MDTQRLVRTIDDMRKSKLLIISKLMNVILQIPLRNYF